MARSTLKRTSELRVNIGKELGQEDKARTNSTSVPAELILQQRRQLRFRNPFLVVAALLLIDLAIPDFVPFIDEILLAILTIIFWSWRRLERDEKMIEPEDGSTSTRR